MTTDIAVFLCAMGSFQALIFGTYFIVNGFRSDARPHVWMGWVLVGLGFGALDTALDHAGLLVSHPRWAFVFNSAAFVLLPSLYLFAKSVSRPDSLPAWRVAVLYVPVLLVSGLVLVIWQSADEAARLSVVMTGQGVPLVDGPWIPLVFHVLALGYVAGTLRILYRHAHDIRERYSNLKPVTLSWLQMTILASILLWIGSLVLVALAGHAVGKVLLLIQSVAILVFINVLLFRGLSQAAAPLPEATRKYAWSGLDEALKREAALRLDRAMAQDRLFCHPDLTLGELAGKIALTPKELSQLLNEELGQNFFDYVNAQRVGWVKSELAAHPDRRILDVMLDAGFNSKSTFNQAFRRHAGQTPSQYRKTLASIQLS